MTLHVPASRSFTRRPRGKTENRPSPLWPLLLLVAVLAYVIVTSSDSPLTSDQRIALFLDSAMSP